MTPDGVRIPLTTRELGSTEIFASALHHSPNGRFITFVGDGEYIIYTALNLRNKSFGNGSSFAWAGDSNTYAVLEGKTKIKAYKNFKERGAGFKGAGTFAVEGLHGGPLLSARGNGFVVFWAWESGEIVRRIDVDGKDVCPMTPLYYLPFIYYYFMQVIWSGTGELVAIVSGDSFYILRYNRDAYVSQLEAGAEIGDEGVEEAFEVVTEVNEVSVFLAFSPRQFSYFI